MIRDGMRAGAAENTRRRQLVLRYPDLAEQLTQPPLALQKPEQWSGCLAPTHTATGAPNRSPVRAQVAALIAEAERRAAPAATPGDSNEPAGPADAR
jgi:hypothetical protein